MWPPSGEEEEDMFAFVFQVFFSIASKGPKETEKQKLNFETSLMKPFMQTY